MARNSARCFRQLAKLDPDLIPEIDARLATLQKSNAENPWFPYYRASLWWRTGNEAIPEFLTEAVTIAVRQSHLEAELEARRWRLKYLTEELGDNEISREDLEALAELASRARDPMMRVKADVAQAKALTLLFDDLEQALSLLYRAEIEGDFENCETPECLRQEKAWLTQLTTTAQALGLFDDGAKYLERYDALVPPEAHFTRAAVAYRWAALHAAKLPSAETRGKVRRGAEEALALSERGDRVNRSVLFESLYLLGKLDTGAGGEAFLERCLDVPRIGAQDSAFFSQCLSAKAIHAAARGSVGRSEIFSWLDQADLLARGIEDSWARITAQMARSRAHWLLGENEAGERHGEALLAELEDRAANQPAKFGRAQVFSVWWQAYPHLAGRLLLGEPSEHEIERAFSIMERARARTLLEQMPQDGDEIPPRLRHRLTELEIRRAEVQRRRMARRQSGDLITLEENLHFERRLLTLERRIGGIRHQIERERPRPTRQETTSLGEIRMALAEDEALLSFQYAPDFDLYGQWAGGSWILATTRDGSWVHRLPDQLELHPKLRDLLDSDKLDAPELLAQLSRGLLSEVMAELPHTIRHLILVPDGDLHLLPFELLQNSPGEELVDRFQLSYAPSATLWHRWRQGGSGRQESKAPALILADPELSGDREDRWGALAQHFRGGPLAPLPNARKEGRSISQRLPGSVLLTGNRASESALAARELKNYALIHFAAHAEVDVRAPERSAIYLAPGPNDDGYLEPQDISSLELDGQLVVLGTCFSSTGPVLRGEGLLSLARAFFEAGARVVVGSRRLLSDDEAPLFFDVFYRELSEGRSVGAALHRAQTVRRRAGASRHDWSALIVLGDAAHVPFPAG